MENRLMKQIEVFDSSPNTVLCGSASRVQSLGIEGRTDTIIPSVSGRLLAASQLFWNVVSTSTVMMRLDLVRNSEITFDQSIEPAEDYGFWFECAGLGLIQIIADVLVERWELSTSASARQPERQLRGAQEVRNRAVELLFPELRTLDTSTYRLLIEGVDPGWNSTEVHDAVAWLEEIARLTPADRRFSSEEIDLIAGAVLLKLTRSLYRESPFLATKILIRSDLRSAAARWAMRRM